MKVAIIAAMWKRPEVFKLWAQWLLRQTSDVEGLDFIVIVAGSEGKESQELAESFGFQYIEWPNDPRGSKLNIRTIRAKAHNPDYVLTLGSDDLLSDRFWDAVKPFMRAGADIIAPIDHYVWNLPTGEPGYWPGYQNERKGEPVASFRLISWHVMDKLSWRPWPKDANGNQADGSSNKRFEKFARTKVLINQKIDQALGIGLKTHGDITEFSRMKLEPVPISLLEDFQGLEKRLNQFREGVPV